MSLIRIKDNIWQRSYCIQNLCDGHLSYTNALTEPKDLWSQGKLQTSLWHCDGEHTRSRQTHRPMTFIITSHHGQHTSVWTTLFMATTNHCKLVPVWEPGDQHTWTVKYLSIPHALLALLEWDRLGSSPNHPNFSYYTGNNYEQHNRVWCHSMRSQYAVLTTGDGAVLMTLKGTKTGS